MPSNIEIITHSEHAFRAADQATIDELGDPALGDHNPAPGHEPTLAGFGQKVAGFKALFPDLKEDLQDIVAGRRYRRHPVGRDRFPIRGGLVTDIWAQVDGVALMQQLGAIPA